MHLGVGGLLANHWRGGLVSDLAVSAHFPGLRGVAVVHILLLGSLIFVIATQNWILIALHETVLSAIGLTLLVAENIFELCFQVLLLVSDEGRPALALGRTLLRIGLFDLLLEPLYLFQILLDLFSLLHDFFPDSTVLGLARDLAPQMVFRILEVHLVLEAHLGSPDFELERRIELLSGLDLHARILGHFDGDLLSRGWLVELL